jgi:hypothetical protein
MATSKSSSEPTAETQAVEEPPAEEPVAEPVPEQQAAAYVLPPTLEAAGLSGVVGVTAGQYSVPSGSFFAISPGQAYVVSGDDAAALIEQGAAVALEDVTPPG